MVAGLKDGVSAPAVELRAERSASALGARVTPAEELPKIVRAWFAAKFDHGRHDRRVQKIREIELDELKHHAAG